MSKILTLILVLIIALAGLAYWYDHAEAPVQNPEDERIMDIETYVRENISQLSPEPAVMGGTFYVTEITTDGDSGTVWYEDGHIALIADFAYLVDKYGITITSFEVRSEE